MMLRSICPIAFLFFSCQDGAALAPTKLLPPAPLVRAVEISASIPSYPKSAPATVEEGHWIAGDLHCHVSPPDNPWRITINVEGIVKLAKERSLSFVIVVPHLWGSTWTKKRRSFLKAHEKFVEEARAQKDIVLIPGVEFGVALGHFNLSGFDLSSVSTENDLLNAARREGAFISVNHPFALNVSGFDMSYRPWTNGRDGFSDFDAVEVWNAKLELTGEEGALVEADKFARSHKKKVSLVGGSDNHSSLLIATTWVYVKEVTEGSILEALREGKTCVGGPEAGSFTAHGDLDEEDSWVPIGSSVHTKDKVELRFRGTAEVFVDGLSQGLFVDSFAASSDESPHTYRIVIEQSRSGFIYANF